jgi:two-component system, NarL family, sensor histidine kinase DegS
MNETHASTLNPSIFLQLQEEERQRLAHALMSGPGQILANALMEVEYSLPLLEKNPKVAVAGLNALRNELREGLEQLKNYVAELQPPLLEEMGLGPSVSQYVKNFGSHTGIRTECRGCEQFRERYPMTIEIALFRILQEALTNVQTHAKATHVRVELTRRANQVQMMVQDNGRGFAPRANAMPKKRQLGLIAMRDRAELLGGQLQLFSENNQGVRVLVTIPYHGHPAEHPIEQPKEGGQELHENTNHNRTRRDGNKKIKPNPRRVKSERV